MVIGKKRRRKKLHSQPLPDNLLHFVESNVSVYRCLPEEDQVELQGLTNIFLDEKWFEGAGGLEITDEIRVTIAAQACLLQLHRGLEIYPSLRTVIVYPGTYIVDEIQRGEDGIEIRNRDIRSGESWSHGAVVLSWDGVMRGAARLDDGQNLVFHEFAHQLDLEDGTSNGAPFLPERSMYSTWAEVLGREYRSLIRDIARQQSTLLHPYGAKNPAEFFAVATELFFERPIELREEIPALYDQLALFYRQDPARYFSC